VPLYEYKCDKCGDVFEVIEKFSDKPLQVHEKCGGPVHRLISTSSFQLKGSGWYATDYARGGKSASKGDGDNKNSADSSAKTESKGSESKGSESKAGDSKTGESKSTESKPAESKPAASDKSKSE
jgi:putative FmdB family regulatory protein